MTMAGRYSSRARKGAGGKPLLAAGTLSLRSNGDGRRRVAIEQCYRAA
jgi:hypothetical protein